MEGNPSIISFFQPCFYKCEYLNKQCQILNFFHHFDDFSFVKFFFVQFFIHKHTPMQFFYHKEQHFFQHSSPLLKSNIPYFYKNVQLFTKMSSFFTKMSKYLDISISDMHYIFKIFFIYIPIHINLISYILMLGQQTPID